MSQHYLLPSNKPGHHWSLCVFRSGARIIATAQEGRAGRSEAIGCTTFEFEMFGDRREQIHLAGVTRLTAKAEREGLAKMHAHLQEKGLLEGATPPAPPPVGENPDEALFQVVGKGHDNLLQDRGSMVADHGEPIGFTNWNGMLRAELKGRPQFNGLIGPMWGGTMDDGRPVMRYETHEANAQLSA